VKRIDDWLVRVGCEDSKVARLVGRPWLISLVARALRPGCKCDTVLILEGPQGRKKSTLFETLVGGREFFTDAHVTYDKDGQMIMHGSWIIELAELATFRKAEELRTKQFVSSPDLTFRPPYGRFTVTLPRHFVFVGTTNDEEYFTDRTGNRRYWPVRVEAEKLDLAWLREAREQLLAEAVVAFEAGEAWWFDVEPEALEAARDARMESNPLVERVHEFVTLREQDEADASKRLFAIGDVMMFLGIPVENKRLTMEVGDALRSLGLKKRREVVNGVRAWRWYRPGWLALVAGASTGGAPAGGCAQPLTLVKVGQEVGQNEKLSDCS
jgi:putative DNA primase/helicase